jgi:hypothetical protein
VSEIPLVGADVDVGENVVVRVGNTGRRPRCIAWFVAEGDNLLAFPR